MLNVYIHKKLEGVEHIHILDYYLGQRVFGVARAGDGAIKLLNKAFFNLVEKPEEADYFLIPHNYFSIKDKGYVNVFIDLSNKYNKKIIVFSYGDKNDSIDIPNSIVFRSSQYKTDLKKNEIIMPAIADDLSVGDLTLLSKKSTPTVGFCGWAGFESFASKWKQKIKSLSYLGNNSAKKSGLLFRMKVLKILDKSRLTNTKFIIRRTFSGNEKTRVGDFNVLRSEFVKNITESDLSLAVKGDGNFSVRFYEILSLGRIPLFIDTDCVLPLEDVVDYRNFILRVDYKSINIVDSIVSNFYADLTQDSFISKQRRAREVFGSFLRIDKYFEYVFSGDFLKKYD